MNTEMTPRPPKPSGNDWPDLGVVTELEAVVPGSGARFLDAYFRALETDDDERRARLRTMVADASHARIYRHLCLFLGTALASGAIALGAYAVAQGTNVYAIAALVTPISGLAGVFVWGAQRPNVVSRVSDPENLAVGLRGGRPKAPAGSLTQETDREPKP
ncbi:hypothetical protein MKL09_14045 [Methylobacterium sp. J-048]|uniref:hypothetical protein n=1 Tax=Methylobacterium sp. J-048 TaxID=2836635 RepID=UPI001FBA2347|nr:hypothetical protein [Methylobacterium sp. J-048]MCJ2057675.1 hypothetical protein [Methylobacterium sp. J-048]